MAAMRHPAGALQHLDTLDRRAERSRELGLVVDHLQAGADHRRRTRCKRCCSSSRCYLNPAIEGGDARVRRIHLARQAPHALFTRIADALQLGANLAAADDGKAHGHPFLSHRVQPSFAH